ncbi:organic cation transporter protein-like isoform X2 [Argiope bruennichi]|nr:organic cation transporter protein-like isoform X2 [Argiope bruennichi]XP_055944697.1 organic cation transporter protein-like isoform X2 [Argiope bruennichi]XP_055944698.1 organic cation transporter protein-like isoform X2 [Argiope bruennichi]XP_055944699.1 organic cation transporter protein-like isoform X2 [Argiope bruennichi]
MTADIEKETPQPSKDDAPEKKLDVFDIVGGDGLWQRCIFLLVLFFSIPAGTHNLVMSFFAPNLDYWCARPEGSNWTLDEWRSIGLPEDDKQCSRYKFVNASYPIDENSTVFRSDEVISCDAWEYDTSLYKSTVLSQWDLVCSREWLVSLSKSVFMAGTFVASLLFGQLADSLGRKPTIIACCAITLFSAVICAFSTSFIMFIVTRFFVSFGISGVYNVSFVLLMELLGPSERSIYGVAINFGWCIGFVSLPGIAWLLRDWFWIQVALTAPCVILLTSWWILPESPRWLMSKGRVDEALKVLNKAAKTNGRKLCDIDTKLKKMMVKATEMHESGEASGNYLDLLRTNGLWQMTLNIYFLWFVNSIVYYGLSYNTNELAGDAFVNFAICGAVEFPAYFLTIPAIRSYGRKNPLAGAMIIGGIACLLMYPLPADPWWLSVTVSMIGKFCITCSFAIAFVFTAEIFPTVVRNIGLGSASVFARIGSILAPFARELGNATHPVVPQVVFGVLAFTSGLLVFFLPETSNVSVPETLAEAAARGRSKKKTKENGHHVTVKLSNMNDDKDVIQDDELTVISPSPKPLANGKKLENVPEEDGHNEITKNNPSPEEKTEQPSPDESQELIPNGNSEVTVQIENADSSTGAPDAEEPDEKTNL